MQTRIAHIIVAVICGLGICLSAQAKVSEKKFADYKVRVQEALQKDLLAPKAE